MPLNYGNNWRTLRDLATAGSLLGALVVVAAIAGAVYEGTFSHVEWWVLPLLFLVPVLAILVPVALTCCASVRVTGRMVQSVLLRRIVLRQFPVKDFVGVESLPTFETFLVFQGGRKLRFTGSDRKALDDLLQHIRLRQVVLPDCPLTDFFRVGERPQEPRGDEGYSVKGEL
jgi:hypothetical protein